MLWKKTAAIFESTVQCCANVIFNQFLKNHFTCTLYIYMCVCVYVEYSSKHKNICKRKPNGNHIKNKHPIYRNGNLV